MATYTFRSCGGNLVTVEAGSEREARGAAMVALYGDRLYAGSVVVSRPAHGSGLSLVTPASDLPREEVL